MLTGQLQKTGHVCRLNAVGLGQQVGHLPGQVERIEQQAQQALLRRTQWPRHHEHGAQQGGVLLAGTFVGNGQVVFGQRLRVLQCGIQPQLKSLCGCTGRSGGRGVSCLLKALSCRIPDDYISKNRYPLFMARAVMRGLIESLQSLPEGSPC